LTVIRWERATPMALFGPSIDEECAIGVARYQRMTPLLGQF